MATQPNAPDLILHSGLFTTLDRSNPAASAVAVKNGVLSAVGRTEERGGPVFRNRMAALLRLFLGWVTPPISPRVPA